MFMGKIVIPKHAAKESEMEAVLKIHYDAHDWVKEEDYKRKLKAMIGANQYSSSYSKKAQIPAYFGFLESHLTPGGKALERRITESGREMYDAIVKNDLHARQRLIMDSLEHMIFGRNNAGAPSSDSDIEPPIILVKCILDTGYCTSAEYAHLVWALNDKGKKYYESLSEVIKSRSAGGILVNSEAKKYKDWKPVLAMIRWGFLQKSDDAQQKVLLDSDVIDNFPERLQKLKVYNIDKVRENLDKDFDEVVICEDDSIGFKPFKIDDYNADKVKEKEESFYQNCKDVESQGILIDDQVLFVNRSLTRLESYYSYIIKELKKNGSEYEVNVQRQFAINRDSEQELINEFRRQKDISNKRQLSNAAKSLIHYDDYKKNLELRDHPHNRDILPGYLVLRALLELDYASNKELDYLMFSIVDGGNNYTDSIEEIKTARKNNKLLYTPKMVGYVNQPSVGLFIEKGILVRYLVNGDAGIRINTGLKEHYESMLRRLSFYAVDIEKIQNKNENKDDALPQVIKAVVASRTYDVTQDNLSIAQEQVLSNNLVQGDFVIFIDLEKEKCTDLNVYQIKKCTKYLGTYKLALKKRYAINPDKQSEIIQMIKETGKDGY